MRGRMLLYHEVCMHACMYVCIYVYTYVCMYVCKYVCMYIYIYRITKQACHARPYAVIS
jgi:hypothetical protein